MERNQEERIRRLEDQQLVDKTEKIYQQQIDERNRRKRTEVVAWVALLIGMAGLIMNIVDKVT